MEDAFQYILERVPFAVLEIHPDNGSEFLNHHLLHFWKETVKGVHLSRSRPYHKNDNPFVEQRNGHPIRTYLGYDRLDTVAQTHAVNRLYDKLWLYLNFFQPVMRVAEKTVVAVDGQPTKTKRRKFRSCGFPAEKRSRSTPLCITLIFSSGTSVPLNTWF